MFDKRINYSKGIIDPKIIDKNPYDVFFKWIKEAINSNLIEEPNAMNVSTIEDDGYPRSRIVLSLMSSSGNMHSYLLDRNSSLIG